MQTKGCTLAVKDVDNAKGIVSGYFSSFDNKDSDGDIIRKGAYSKTVTERGPLGTGQIKHLLQHNRNQPIGKILELREDDRGLFFTSQLSKSTLGQDTLIQYQEGIYNEHSVGFFPVKQAFSKADDANIITEIKLLEGSVVTWGANSATPVTDIKSLEEDFSSIKDRLNRISKHLKSGKGTDELFKLLEEEHNQLLNQYQQLLTLATVQPPAGTEKNEPDAKDSSESIDLLKLFREQIKLN